MSESFGIFFVLLFLWLVYCQKQARKERKENDKKFKL